MGGQVQHQRTVDLEQFSFRGLPTVMHLDHETFFQGESFQVLSFRRRAWKRREGGLEESPCFARTSAGEVPNFIPPGSAPKVEVRGRPELHHPARWRDGRMQQAAPAGHITQRVVLRQKSFPRQQRRK